MSRFVLFLIAAAAVVCAQYVDRGTAHLAGTESFAQRDGGPSADDAILTGSTRRQPAR
ncbi:hypothetical protein [Phreatobacter stygius]|uniref:hypothetical protein n=1 Tax=Phreatobacter stygius TaxID=1940610 RepID=UPI00147738B0|nr:hypothetical protein [Phreatobacter stygius]